MWTFTGSWLAVCHPATSTAGRLVVHVTPGAFAPAVAQHRSLSCVIDGDLDNAATLEHDLGVPRGTLNDAALVLRAYERWGMDDDQRRADDDRRGTDARRSWRET